MKKIVILSLAFLAVGCFASPFEKFYPKIKGHEFSMGKQNSDIEIVAYLDLECPFSKRSFPHFEKIMKDYRGRVHLVFKHYPLKFHKNAQLAANYFEAIRLQDEKKALTFMKRVFDHQGQIKKDKETLVKLSEELGLDQMDLKRDVKSKAVVGLVEDNRLEAISYKINGTPVMYINGTRLSGSFPYKHVKRTIDGIIETE